MRTAKGSTFENLLDIATGIRKLTVTLNKPLEFQRDTEENHAALVQWVTDTILRGKKGAGVLQKYLEQIEHHRELLARTYEKLYESYTYAMNPIRQSPIERARRQMFEAMPDKLLKLNCAVYLKEEQLADIILPDDREKLIEMTLIAMSYNKE